MKNKYLKYSFILSFIVHMLILNVCFNNKTQLNSLKKNQEVKKLSVVKLISSPKQQIVQTSESNKKDPVKDSFLSDKNNTFDRQTVARVVDKFRINNGTSNTENIKKTSARSKGVKSLAKLGVGLPEVVKKSSSAQDEALLHEVSSLASASNDYVTDVPLADISRFNTTEYKHFGFFQRIRNQLEQHWGSTLKEKAKRIYKTGRKIASENDFITNIEVALDNQGKITGIKIIGSSGVKELDDAAIESFNKAGPFPNPPKDLVNNGMAIIKWGFVVKS